MKKVFLMALVLICGCLWAEEKSAHKEAPKEEAKSQRYRHIQDAEGKILATLDTKDGSIDYKDEPKKVVPILISVIDNIANECQKRLNEKAAPVANAPSVDSAKKKK